MQLLKEISYGFRHLLFPSLCEGCKKPLYRNEELICLNCETYLSRTNYHHIKDNETALRLWGRLPFVHATSLAYFTKDGLLQHLIHGLKYKGKKQNGFFLGKELGKAISELDWNIDAIVPVPLHKKKEALRGYNQSNYICDGLAETLKVPILTKTVIRSRFTESQTDKAREQRIDNVRDAFTVKNTDTIAGKHVLLIDDVLTTGATVESCGMALLSVPGVSLSVATIGIANNY